MNDKTGLKKDLVSKMREEYQQFLKNLEHKEPKEIIEAAYEKISKEDIIIAVEENDFSLEQLTALNDVKFPLESCYAAWLKSEVTYMETLFLCVEDHAEMLFKSRKTEDRSERRTETMANNNDRITFEIKEKIAVLAEFESGWKKELNLVSWNGNQPKYDIRDWSEDYTHMSRGVTLTADEMKKIRDAMNDRNLENEKVKKDREYER